jgi:hypothetical protein
MRLVLPATGLDIEVPDNFHYYADGPVSSLILHINQLSKNYGDTKIFSQYTEIIESSPFPNLWRKYAIAHHLKIKTASTAWCCKEKSTLKEALKEGAKICCHTFYLNFLGKKAVISEGHEELHVAIELGQLDVFKYTLEAADIDSRGLEKLSIEDICEIGGCYASIRKFRQREQYRSPALISNLYDLVSFVQDF